jgi:hypothetical protein
VTALFAAATFLGAFLLFLVQPLIAKYILPWFGGGAAVWTTCLLFFQVTLLAGYLYAHLGVSRIGSVRAQVAIHALMLITAAALAWPSIAPGERWEPLASASGESPIGQILLLLVATVGVPCVALSATSPLLHAWYSRICPGTAVYRLYALSNAGSLLALLAYPLVVEPLLPRRMQAIAWSIALCVFAVLCGACAMLAGRHRVVAERETVVEASDDAGFARTFLWLALPACASALLLATTNSITQDFAPIPLLWIVPLTLYLLTFIIAFDRPHWYYRPVFGCLLAASIAGAAYVLFYNDGRLPLAIGVGGVIPAMFFGCMVLHGELARLNPPTRQLTSYYLMIAAGGAIGGSLVAVGAPLLLGTYSELPAALWACCALALVTPLVASRKMPSGIAGVLGIAGVMTAAPVLWSASHLTLAGGTWRSSTRDFYGVLTLWDVQTPEPGVVLHHGGITHGHQFVRPSRRATPTTYYHADSGVGFVLGKDLSLPKPRRVGAIGLGGGTVAAYANAGDSYRFYEISPSVVRVANETFTYLKDARARGATVDTVLGDGRLSMEREPRDLKFDVIVLDAFSGDAIPVHLLTDEAFYLYKQHLSPSGIVCVHVSNNYLDLRPVVVAGANRLGWQSMVVNTDSDDSQARFGARWVLVSADPNQIAKLRAMGGEEPLPALTDKFKPWTDEHADVLHILRWRAGT